MGSGGEGEGGLGEGGGGGGEGVVLTQDPFFQCPLHTQFTAASQTLFT